MYRSLIITLTIFLSLFFFSCQLKERKKYVIGVSQCSDDLWRNRVNEEMKREASFYQDISLITKIVKDDSEKQIKDIESLIDSGVDLLVISPNESSALTPVIEKAYNQNIPVILLDRKIETDKYTAYIGGDNYQLSKELGIYATDILKGQGNVFIMRGLKGATADSERYKGFVEIISKYPDINIVGESWGDFLEDTSEQEMSKFMKQKKPIDLVFAMNDPMAYGVHKALMKYSGKRPYVIGIDALSGDDGGVSAIEKGVIDASFIYPTGGDKVIELAHKILNKEDFKRENILYTAVVDKNNAHVLQLQQSQIVQQEDKFDKINTLLNTSLAQYSNQQTLFYLSLVAMLLITGLLFFAYMAYQSKNEANLKLEKKNDEISKQARVLEDQKNELISLSKQLEEATNSKLMFFTNVSHEFKTPLSLILGPIDLLLELEHTQEKTELLRLAKKNSNRLLSLISEIIEFRTFENGKTKISFTNNDLIPFIKSVSSHFDVFIKQKSVNFKIDIEDSSLNLWFDKEKIETVYFNLLSNAFKHVNYGGSIIVTLRKIQKNGIDLVDISVQNTGSYIPLEEQYKIFDRFYMIENEVGGTGIGLALSSAMVEMHRGQIFVNSELETGTTFHVLLPLEQFENKISISEQNNYVVGSFSESNLELEGIYDTRNVPLLMTDNNKPLLLLVEDNQDMRRFMQLALKGEYNVMEAENGAVGIEKAIKYTPDLIISDVMMPEINGFGVCKTLKENVSTSHIPIIMLTACSLDEEKSMGFESGADAYIPKPFNENLLKIRIRKLIENRQKIKEVFESGLINDDKKEMLAAIEQTFIDNITNYVEQNISNPDLTVEDIAKHIGLSKSQLYRKLKSITDYSPNELIRIIRLKYAKKLLLRKSKSISEVAYESGFSSPSYFSKCYKDFYNENPSDFV